MISTVLTRQRCKTAKIVGSWCRQKFFSNVKLACIKISHSLTPFDIKECIQTNIGRISADVSKGGRSIFIPPWFKSNLLLGVEKRTFHGEDFQGLSMFGVKIGFPQFSSFGRLKTVKMAAIWKNRIQNHIKSVIFYHLGE